MFLSFVRPSHAFVFFALWPRAVALYFELKGFGLGVLGVVSLKLAWASVEAPVSRTLVCEGSFS